MGKGSGRRPAQIPYNEYLQNWERIFGRYAGVDLAPKPSTSTPVGWYCWEEVVLPHPIVESQRQALLQIDEELEPTRRAVQQQMDEEKKRGCYQ